MHRRTHFFGWIPNSRCLMIAAGLLAACALMPPPATAQEVPHQYQTPHQQEAQEIPGILRNIVGTMASDGSRLWIGPYLQHTDDGGETWNTARAPELERGGPNRLASLALQGDTLVAGLATTAADQSAAAGFLVSTNRGQTLHARPVQLDIGTEDTLQYGAGIIPALPVTDPRGSPPFDVAIGPETDELWVAGGRSGLRRSGDLGESWERVVLPPDDLKRISPDEEYDFELRPPDGTDGHDNHETYSVLVDGEGTIWAGTAAGLNRSSQEDLYPSLDGTRAWERIGAGDAPDGLPGELVVALAEQEGAAARPIIWIATWPGGVGEQIGVVRTTDGGATFEHFLHGERARDFAFIGDETLVATDRGIFRLDVDGDVVDHISTFPTPDQPQFDAPDPLSALAVTTTRQAIWVGTEVGLFESTDGGESWRVFRTEVPTRPEEPSEDIPSVDTYAYPNPFSPGSGAQRIVVEVEEPQQIRIQIFDYAMNLVRTISDNCSSSGRCEVAWRGEGNGGRHLANGTYFYTVRADQQTYRGKIVVLE